MKDDSKVGGRILLAVVFLVMFCWLLLTHLGINTAFNIINEHWVINTEANNLLVQSDVTVKRWLREIGHDFSAAIERLDNQLDALKKETKESFESARINRQLLYDWQAQIIKRQLIIENKPPLTSRIMSGDEGIELTSSFVNGEYVYSLRNIGKIKIWMVSSIVIEKAIGLDGETSHWWILSPGKEAIVKCVNKNPPVEVSGQLICFDPTDHNGIKDHYRNRNITIDGQPTAYYFQMSGGSRGYVPNLKRTTMTPLAFYEWLKIYLHTVPRGTDALAAIRREIEKVDAFAGHDDERYATTNFSLPVEKLPVEKCDNESCGKCNGAITEPESHDPPPSSRQGSIVIGSDSSLGLSD